LNGIFRKNSGTSIIDLAVVEVDDVLLKSSKLKSGLTMIEDLSKTIVSEQEEEELEYNHLDF
jgi:hypothetical protein